MSETLDTRLTGNLAATLINTLPLSTVTDTAQLALTTVLASGVGANKANQIFSDQRTIVAGGSDVINVYNFNGTDDAVGSPLTMAKAKMIFVQNLDGTESNSLRMGGEGTSNAW